MTTHVISFINLYKWTLKILLGFGQGFSINPLGSLADGEKFLNIIVYNYLYNVHCTMYCVVEKLDKIFY